MNSGSDDSDEKQHRPIVSLWLGYKSLRLTLRLPNEVCVRAHTPTRKRTHTHTHTAGVLKSRWPCAERCERRQSHRARLSRQLSPRAAPRPRYLANGAAAPAKSLGISLELSPNNILARNGKRIAQQRQPRQRLHACAHTRRHRLQCLQAAASAHTEAPRRADPNC